jgi:hypothetical protein
MSGAGKQFVLKQITADGIPHALEKAERYRLLNDPEQAESICHDILAVDPDNQDTLQVLVLALSDQFASGGVHGGVRVARGFVNQLTDEYDRAYYTGIVFEREARAFLRRAGMIRSAAYDGFRQAMEWYERAEGLRPPGNVDALLRWNSCVRTIERERLEPEPEQREQPLE